MSLARLPLPGALERRGNRRLLHRPRRDRAGARLLLLLGRAKATILFASVSTMTARDLYG
jgi:hypothetical protein